ncbi:metallophosphoesterase [Cuspidothrix issatschenkoi LEGE 03284]|uniref:metallophosphoesterase family protein n=1 Tax=Cuspidothrix issatschenkoi TaxID=230752 RepID=UPI0018828A05|nr:metallophosphoesterase [Cuspidothrix issatschenkoi]MBE9231770.1 metallophosphoesterase [Cuspidothrix issatschenkoi LEGE 03284]
MKLISEPSILVKIEKMKQRVRWGHLAILQQGIDQTSMVIDDGQPESPDFSFMVMGDTGTKSHSGHHPQREVAKMMLNHGDDCHFVLHTGDVIYMVGSREYYPANFIEPYREFLLGGDSPENIAYDKMIFELPILPVLGNHDYYDVPLLYRLLTGPTLFLRQMLRYKDIEIGWHGSNQGDAYARAFLDYLADISPLELESHLSKYYNAEINMSRCLRYQPGKFTRLPNRYYTFCYGGIDFFALDSNTFNTPDPLPNNQAGDSFRRELEQRRQQIDREELQILGECDKLNPDQADEAELLAELGAKLDQVNEIKIDIEKQLASHKNSDVDFEQLAWLKERLIASWQNSAVRGRVIFFHHPPYVTEATKWNQGQTLAVRHRLREVFDQVAKNLGHMKPERPLVDIVFSGHAHCLEHLRTVNTGHADSYINYIISGGSGRRPRPQRPEGSELLETFMSNEDIVTQKVADSLLYVGRSGYGFQKKKPYSCVRVDVKAGFPAKFKITPLITELIEGKWCDRSLENVNI